MWSAPELAPFDSAAVELAIDQFELGPEPVCQPSAPKRAINHSDIHTAPVQRGSIERAALVKRLLARAKHHRIPKAQTGEIALNKSTSTEDLKGIAPLPGQVDANQVSTVHD